MGENRCVLVLDCWTRKALSVVRSLGRVGVLVHAASHTMLAAPMQSRFVGRRLRLPNPSQEPLPFAETVMRLLETQRYDCVFALEDSSMAALIPHRARIERLTRFPVASAEAIETAGDKWSTYQAASSLGVPAPRSMRVTSAQEAAAAGEAIGFPLILKPLRSSGSRGLARVYTHQQIRQYFTGRSALYDAFIAQEALPADGPGLGVAVLADHGQARMLFSYRRLREFPVSGGPSTLRESTDDPVIKRHTERIIERLGWHGVAMFEYKIDTRDGAAKLLEINPRFWGSLELANAAGINFPEQLLRLSLGETVYSHPYRVGARCRWLVPGDIAHFIANPQRMTLDPPFFRFFDANTKYDEFTSDDVPGSVASVVCAALSLFDPAVWRMGVLRK